MVHILPHALSLGGTERTVLDLVTSRELADLEQRVAFIRSGPVQEFPPDIILTALPPRHNSLPAALRDIARARPRVVHGWLLAGNLFGALTRVMAPSTRLVTSERNLGDELTRGSLALERIVARMETVATANSTAVAEAAVARLPARQPRMHVILPGIATPERTRQTTATTIVMVGRLHPVKDHATALRAWALVCATEPRPTLTIVGDGPERARLERLARELEITDAVRFAGETDPRPHLYGARGFLCTSLAEGFSRGLLEALLTGLPAVSTAVGGTSDLPPGAVTLVPLADPPAIAAALRTLLADPEAPQRAEQTAAVVSRLFSAQACHQSYRRLYARLGAS